MMQCDPITYFELSDRCADSDHGSRRFMPKNSRRRNGAILDFFDIGRTNPAHGNLDQYFVGPDAGNGNGFDAQVVGTSIHDRAHGLGDREHVPV